MRQSFKGSVLRAPSVCENRWANAPAVQDSSTAYARPARARWRCCANIDSKVLIRVEQGKVGEDRHAMLAPQLLELRPRCSGSGLHVAIGEMHLAAVLRTVMSRFGADARGDWEHVAHVIRTSSRVASSYEPVWELGLSVSVHQQPQR